MDRMDFYARMFLRKYSENFVGEGLTDGEYSREIE